MSTTPSQPTSAQPSAETKTYQEKITQDLIVTAFKAGRESGLREGFALGEKEGLSRGKKDGHALGFEEGKASGFRKGHAWGRLDGKLGIDY
jgi:flagellar biosynthesis/type III secretory pathway protein FliH